MLDFIINLCDDSRLYSEPEALLEGRQEFYPPVSDWWELKLGHLGRESASIQIQGQP